MKLFDCKKINYISLIQKGDIDEAKDKFIKAYQCSLIACGKDVPITQKLLELSVNTPKTAEDLMLQY